MPHIRDSSYEKGEILSIIAIVFLTISLIGVTAATNAGPQLINSFAKFTEGTGEEKTSKEESKKNKEKKEEKLADKPADNNLTMGGIQEGTGSVPLDTNQPVTEVNQVKEKTDDGFITHTTTITTDPATDTIIDANTVSTTNEVTTTKEKTDDGFITHTTTTTKDVDTNEIVNSQTTNTTNETSTEFIETDEGTIKVDTTVTTNLDTGETNIYTTPGALLTPSFSDGGFDLGGALSGIGQAKFGGPTAFTEENLPQTITQINTISALSALEFGGLALGVPAIVGAQTAGVPITTYLYAQTQTILTTNPIIPQTLNAINVASKAVSLTQCASLGNCNPSSIVPSPLGSGLSGLNAVNNMNSFSIDNPLKLVTTANNILDLPSTAAVAAQQAADVDPTMVVATMGLGGFGITMAPKLSAALQDSIAQNISPLTQTSNSTLMLQGFTPFNPVIQPINVLAP